MSKLENLNYLHLELIGLVATRLNVSSLQVVANETLENIIYSIQDDQCAGLDCLDLMAELAIKQYHAELEREETEKATRTIRFRNYWEQKIAELG